MIHYLFDDIFHNFRFFFNTQKYKDSKFLYDISFGLKPRRFEANDDEKLIYDEEDEVSEMYFIQEGTVSVSDKIYHVDRYWLLPFQSRTIQETV